jgi:hypothetical protein
VHSAFLELSLGILATCIATFRPLFAQTRKIFHEYYEMKNTDGQQHSRTMDSGAHEPNPADGRIAVTTMLSQTWTDEISEERRVDR